MTEPHIPAIVMSLAQKVGKKPMEWKEYPDRVVIIFTNGQKMVFDRQELSPTMSEYDLTPAKKPAAQKSTIKNQKSKMK